MVFEIKLLKGLQQHSVRWMNGDYQAKTATASVSWPRRNIDHGIGPSGILRNSLSGIDSTGGGLRWVLVICCALSLSFFHVAFHCA
jgi:hypothetical protein